MFLIQSGILARGVEVEAMDVSEGPPPRKRGRPFTTGKIGGGAYCSAVGCHNNEGRDRAWSCVVLQLGIVGSCFEQLARSMVTIYSISSNCDKYYLTC